ncbi:MAG: 1-deoxy-D-xylulose-5-phosphate reductoisomerase [Planctomycetota bacterium]
MPPPDDPIKPRRLIVLGSTGSIGTNTLAVADHLTRTAIHPFNIVGLAANTAAPTLAQQATQHRCTNLALADPHTQLPATPGLDPTVYRGPDAAEQLVQQTDADTVVAAIVGAAGLPATLAAIQLGRTVGLANKETLVAAGPLVMPLVEGHGSTLLPIDSEHSAIFQCCPALGGSSQVVGGRSNQNTTDQPPTTYNLQPTTSIRRIVLTASGGPFRTASKAAIQKATPEQALKHPTWSMGPKITIDSATMMNKTLEIIEAHHLFNLPADQIDVLVHPQSTVHGLVEFADGSTLAQLGPPDMRTPIQVALTWPDRLPGCSDRPDWSMMSQLEFHPPDLDRFPALLLARRVIEQGGTTGATLNAANEAAVDAFLNRRIPLGRITELVTDTLDALPPQPITSLDDVLEADRQARESVENRLASNPVSA